MGRAVFVGGWEARNLGKNLPGKYHPEEKISSPAEKISPKVGKNPPLGEMLRHAVGTLSPKR